MFVEASRYDVDLIISLVKDLNRELALNKTNSVDLTIQLILAKLEEL